MLGVMHSAVDIVYKTAAAYYAGGLYQCRAFGTKPMYIGMRLAAAYGAGDIRWIYCVKYRLYQSTHGCFR